MTEAMSDGKGDRRLSSWKEIAQFFGKDERTVNVGARPPPRAARHALLGLRLE